MFNRIRVVTMLMMVLGVFALLQLVSGGLLFSSLQFLRTQLQVFPLQFLLNLLLLHVLYLVIVLIL